MQSNNKPTLSVILPAYNAENYINQAIDSIINQTFEDFELIIADDGSKDRTKNIIDSYSDQRIITSHNDSNVGKVLTVNRLLTLSKGEYLTIHDADDFSLPERFEKQMNFLYQHKENAGCGTYYFEKTKNRSFEKLIVMPESYELIKAEYLKKGAIHGPTFIFRKKVLQKIGGLYRFMPFHTKGDNKEDVEFISRIIENYEVANIPTPLYYYRNLPYSISKLNHTYLKFEGMKIIKFLSEERKKNGIDSFSVGGSDKLNAFLKDLEAPYIKDKSLIHHKSAEFLLHYNFFSQAISQSISSIMKEPFMLKNYRLLQHCLRKVILESFKHKPLALKKDLKIRLI